MLRPCSIPTVRPAASTASTGAASTSASSPGSAEKASASSPAIVASPARFREPLLTAAHDCTWSSIGSAPARSTAARSSDDSSTMETALAGRFPEGHTASAGHRRRPAVDRDPLAIAKLDAQLYYCYNTPWKEPRTMFDNPVAKRAAIAAGIGALVA